jgi:hypothetical protein
MPVNSGFDLAEALDLLALSAIVEGGDAPKSPPATADQLTPLGFDVAVTPSLNFVNAGTDVSLIGTPCVDAQCQDAFFEHHATAYYELMRAQLQVS